MLELGSNSKIMFLNSKQFKNNIFELKINSKQYFFKPWCRAPPPVQKGGGKSRIELEQIIFRTNNIQREAQKSQTTSKNLVIKQKNWNKKPYRKLKFFPGNVTTPRRPPPLRCEQVCVGGKLKRVLRNSFAEHCC